MLDQFGMATTNRQMSDQENAQAFNQYLGLNTLYANIGMGLSGQGINAANGLIRCRGRDLGSIREHGVTRKGRALRQVTMRGRAG